MSWSKQVAKYVANYTSKILQKEGKEQNNILSLQPVVFAPVLVCHRVGEIVELSRHPSICPRITYSLGIRFPSQCWLFQIKQLWERESIREVHTKPVPESTLLLSK